MSLNPLDIIKAYVASEPTRLIVFVTGVALTGANAIGHALGYTELPDGVANAIALLVAALMGEAIRRFVYSPKTVEAIAEASAVTGVAQVPAPPADNFDT